MFSILFGLHFALRAVIDWIWNRENHANHGYDDKYLLPPSDLLPSSDLDLNAAATIDSPDGSDLTYSPRDVITQSQNDVTRKSDNKMDAEISSGPRHFEHVHSEWPGYSPRKRVLPDEIDSGLGEDVVPVKVAHLSSTPVISEKAFDVKKVHGYHNMPFLSDEKTVNYIKRSHTMFLMRGLSGSGKSTLVKCIKTVYHGSVAVCSADDFFTDKDGNYNFDIDKRSEAHKHCQNKTAYHCDKGTRVVIIDNTNIQRWEMSFYIKLAQRTNYYHLIIVEPQTPWRYEPMELAKRNTHNVPEEVIYRKLQSLTSNEFKPLYYGWFLSKDDSSMLVNQSRDVLRKCLSELRESINDDSASLDSLQDISDSVVISYSGPVPMLHCTAAYLARRAKDPYHTSQSVTEAMGCTFSLHISGFVYTRRSLSARVSFWYRNDDPDKDSSILYIQERVTSPIESSIDKKINQALSGHINRTNSIEINQADLFMKEEEEKLREKYQDVHVHNDDSDRKHAVFQHGCSAHVTIGYANDGQSKLSGDDIINILELDFYGKVQQNQFSSGILSTYGPDMYQIQLREPLKVHTLFQGFYSARG